MTKTQRFWYFYTNGNIIVDIIFRYPEWTFKIRFLFFLVSGLVTSTCPYAPVHDCALCSFTMLNQKHMGWNHFDFLTAKRRSLERLIPSSLFDGGVRGGSVNSSQMHLFSEWFGKYNASFVILQIILCFEKITLWPPEGGEWNSWWAWMIWLICDENWALSKSESVTPLTAMSTLLQGRQWF